MEEMIRELVAAAEALAEDAELVDDLYWGYLASVSKMDALKDALDRVRKAS